MKVVRHASHYSIRLTLTEYEALVRTYRVGLDELVEGDERRWKYITRREKMGLTRLRQRGAWAVEDRRGNYGTTTNKYAPREGKYG